MSLRGSTRARLTAATVLLLVLAAGVVLGVALDRHLEAREILSGEPDRREGRSGYEDRRRGFDPRPRDPSRGPSDERDSNRRRPSMLVDQLGLSEIQKELVDSIVGYFRIEMRELHEEFDEAYSARVRELNGRARNEVRAVLTDEQRIAYDSLQSAWAQRRQERRENSTEGKR